MSLKPLLQQAAQSRPLRIIEAHSPLSALIGATASKNGKSFDAIWLGSFTRSALAGLPDDESIWHTPLAFEQLEYLISQCQKLITKPIIFDADSGGPNFSRLLEVLHRNKISAVIIEDKIGQKITSLHENSAQQKQANINEFCSLIKTSVNKDELMIIARIESLITGAGMDDALKRALAYVKAGAHGIMIHSKSKTADEVKLFAKEFKKSCPDVPLIMVPTTYNGASEDELYSAGANIIIYANQLLCAAYKAMADAAESILDHGRAQELEKSGKLSPVIDMIHLFDR